MELIIFWLLCAIVTAIVANSKGRSGIGWFFIGLLTGIFGIILVALLPRVGAQAQTVPTATRETKECPECAEDIMRAARVCKNCGHRFA